MPATFHPSVVQGLLDAGQGCGAGVTAAGGLALMAAVVAGSGSDIALQGGQLRRGGGGQVWIGTWAGLDEGPQRCGELAGRALEAVGGRRAAAAGGTPL